MRWQRRARPTPNEQRRRRPHKRKRNLRTRPMCVAAACEQQVRLIGSSRSVFRPSHFRSGALVIAGFTHETTHGGGNASAGSRSPDDTFLFPVFVIVIVWLTSSLLFPPATGLRAVCQRAGVEGLDPSAHFGRATPFLGLFSAAWRTTCCRRRRGRASTRGTECTRRAFFWVTWDFFDWGGEARFTRALTARHERRIAHFSFLFCPRF